LCRLITLHHLGITPLLTMGVVLGVVLAGVAIKSFGHASSSAPAPHENTIATRAKATDARTPTRITPAPAIDVGAEFSVGAGDGSGIGTARMMDMVLTGRIYEAEEGQAIGISHYLIPPGGGLAKGIEIATRIAGNSPISNFAITHALPRIAQSDAASGYIAEALIGAIAQHSHEAGARLKAFREKRAPKPVRA
jgi:hypothetical protein